MGLFDTFKKLIKKQRTEPQKSRPEVKKKAQTVVKQVKRKRPRQKPEHEVLREWRAELKRLQEHPLTQAKIVNERLLAAVMDLLNEINSKLEELNLRIAKLESIARQTQKKAPVAPLKIKLSSKEQSVLDYVKQNTEVKASDVAAALNISRSNAALKLNKLFSINLLDKRQDGKDVYFFAK
ncbi:MAG: hypothetical protein QW063_01185 [Candidatus Nanoarchaeia archaeon]